MKASSVISVKSVSKSFRVHTERRNSLKDRVLYAGRHRYREFKALEDVSLEIERGSTVGLIGVNGSGKSTLLKLISRILYPDKGTVEVRGKVSSLLELGAGFHPDFTGTENIYLNASLIGLSKREISRKEAEVIEFSELGDFIHEPIRSYSSGMYMRLAFSIAVAVDPEILLIDEILAVGDAAFQAKCLDRLKQLQTNDKTIVIVTHDTGVVERLCDRAIWLNSSRIRVDGDPIPCVQAYLQSAFSTSHSGVGMSFDRSSEPADTGDEERRHNEDISEEGREQYGIRLDSAVFKAPSGEDMAHPDDMVSIAMFFTSSITRDDVIFGVSIFRNDGTFLYGTDTNVDLTGRATLRDGERLAVVLSFEKLPFPSGEYYVDLKVSTEFGEPLGFWNRCCEFTMVADARGAGLLHLDHEWTIESQETSVLKGDR